MAKSAAVVIGVGDGSQSRAVAMAGYHRVVTIALPGETPPPGLPGHLYVCRGDGAAADVISHGFADHAAIVRLPDTDFYDRHPIALPDHERTRFCTEFYELLGRMPFTLGDDVNDGLQGAWHIAKSCRWTIQAPKVRSVPRLAVPAIAVATGPSLKRHLDSLRRLQDRCLIVACDSSLDGLLREDIRPHVVTPYERVPQIVTESFTADRYPGIVFAGPPVVHHAIPEKFDRHIYVPGTDLLYLWAEAERPDLVWHGQSTATVAVAVARILTSGTVYLVGHDLAYDAGVSHWAGVHADVVQPMEENVFPVQGNGDGTVTTRYWWDVFRREIAGMARDHGGIANVNALDGVGAAIPGTLAERLPDPDRLPPFAGPDLPSPHPERLAAFRHKLRELPRDAQRMLTALSSMRLRSSDLDMRRLCPGANGPFFSYTLRSVLAQFSMDLHSGKAEHDVVAGMADALRNSLRGILPMLEEMAQC